MDRRAEKQRPSTGTPLWMDTQVKNDGLSTGSGLCVDRQAKTSDSSGSSGAFSEFCLIPQVVYICIVT